MASKTRSIILVLAERMHKHLSQITDTLRCAQSRCDSGNPRVLASIINFPPVYGIYVYLNCYGEIFTDTADVHGRNC